MTTIEKKVIDFGKLISQSTENYVGRQWVREAVDDFLKASNARYFLLLGEPGSGKTAFMADLVQRRQYLHHFIGKGCQIDFEEYSRDWHNPVRFAESVGYQLVCEHGEWVMSWEDWGISVDVEVKEVTGLLTGAEVGQFNVRYRPADKPVLKVEEKIRRFGAVARNIGVFVEEMKMDPELIVHQLLKMPLWNIAEKYPEDQIVVIVDGLDEAESYSNDKVNIFKMLPDGELPANVRFLLSSRPGKHLNLHELSGGVQKFWLSEDEEGHRDPGTVADAEAFIRELAVDEPIRQILERHRISAERLADRVAKASQGNFLYLHHYAQGLRKGNEALLSLEALPKGLDRIYDIFLKSISGRLEQVECFAAYKPVLGTLAVAREPLTQEQIANYSGVDLEKVATVCIEIGQFLDSIGETAGERHYTIYHRSFAEFVISPRYEDRIYDRKAHRGIVEYYQSEVGSWNEPYAMKYLLSHMIASESWDDVKDLLTDIEYLEKKQQPENQYRFQADFIRLLQADTIPADKLTRILGGILHTITGQVESDIEDRKRKADWLDTFAYWINEFGVKKTSGTRASTLKIKGDKFDEECGKVSKALATEYEAEGKYDFAMRFAELYTWVWQRAGNFRECVEACKFAKKICGKEGMPAAYRDLGKAEFIRMRAYAYKMFAGKNEKSKNLGLAREAYDELCREFSSNIWMPEIAEWETLEGDKGTVLSLPSQREKFKARVVSNAHDCIGAIHIIRFFMEQNGTVEWIHHKDFAPERLTSDGMLFTVLIGGPKAPGISDVALEFYRFSEENAKVYLRMYSGLHIEANRLYMKSENTHCYMLGGISKLNTLMAAYEFTEHALEAYPILRTAE